MSLVGAARHTADGVERLPGLGTWQQEGASGTRHLGHSDILPAHYIARWHAGCLPKWLSKQRQFEWIIQACRMYLRNHGSF